MPSLTEFTAQLERCAQSPAEIRAFVDAFSRVRLRYIVRQLGETAPVVVSAASTVATQMPIDWSDNELLAESGLKAEDLKTSINPGAEWLHVTVAASPTSEARAVVSAFLDDTCLSEKQRKVLFPGLLAKMSAPEMIIKRRAETSILNSWLRWAREENIRPSAFGNYQRHLRIHGASQNAGGNVGAVGGAIAVLDALEEIVPKNELRTLGVLPPANAQDPLSVDTFLRQFGLAVDGKERPLKCVLLANGRAIMFASDPDIAIIQALGEPFRSPQHAWDVYSRVRSNAQLRAQTVHEFAVGETKTATDPSNLHERLALSTRETRSERQADRFLMMAILTSDLLTGSAGAKGRRNTRAPMQSREMSRVTDVFNLHHAWGWDGGRERHPEHWAWFKHRLKDWTGL